ncbi:MAG: hypothetical protein V1746_03850 [bacterium]
MKTIFFRTLVYFVVLPVCGALAQMSAPSSNVGAPPPMRGVLPPPAGMATGAGLGAQPVLLGDWVQKYDANKDGKLDDNERAAMQRDIAEKKVKFEAEILAKYDANKDGKLDGAERKIAQAEQKKLLEKKLLEKYDKNKDGKLDADERMAMQQDQRGQGGQKPLWRGNVSGSLTPILPTGPAFLQNYDANKDGKLDEGERAAMQKDMEEKRAKFEAERLAKYDANKDGKLDEAEKGVMQKERRKEMEEHQKKFQQDRAQFLQKHDVNKDGKLDEEERKEAAKDDKPHPGLFPFTPSNHPYSTP